MSRRSRRSRPFSLFAFQDIITSVTGIMILVTMMLTLELLHRKERSPQVQTDQTIEQVESIARQIRQQIVEAEAQLDANSDVLQFDQTTLQQQIDELTEARQQMDSEVQKLRIESLDAQQRQREISRQEQSRTDTPQTLAQIETQIRQTQQQLQKLKQSHRMIFNPSAGDRKAPWLVEIEAGRIAAARVGESAPPQVFTTGNQFLNWSSRRNPRAEYFVLLVKPGGVDGFDMLRRTLTADGFDVGFDVMAVDQTAIDPQTGAAP